MGRNVPLAASATGTRARKLEDFVPGRDLAFLRLRSRPPLLRVRGRSRDGLEALGRELFHDRIQEHLDVGARRALAEDLSRESMLLVSDLPDFLVRPIARQLGFSRFAANRPDYRDGRATGRWLEPRVGRGFDPARHADAIQDTNGRRPSAAALVRFDSEDRFVGPDKPLSVRRALAGKRILLVGVSGFIGKIWLAQLLREVPDLEKVFLLIRRRGRTTAQRRFEQIVERSPVFESLHHEHGEDLGRFLGRRIEILEGDVTEVGLGTDPITRRRLQSQVDLVVNSSGLTEFNPDPREALVTNVEAPRHLLRFCRAANAALLHLSTCFVVGEREGRIPEILTPAENGRGELGFDASEERRTLHELIRKAESLSEKQSRSRWRREFLTNTCLARARRHGWPNIYTYTKSLGEAVIASEAGSVPFAVVRPSIVESSLEFPFRGWNEGINTSTPLSYVLGTAFRQLPANRRKILDCVPVDLVARGMSLVAAALLERRHEFVYHLGSSTRNPLSMDRAVDLTGLAHRQHYRAQNDWASRVLAHLGPIIVSRSRYDRLSVPAQLSALRALRRLSGPLSRRLPLAQWERHLARIGKVVDLYQPFIRDHEHVFDTDHIEFLTAALPESERDTFGFDTRGIDWSHYWIDVHIPAVRRWCYPLLHGKAPERTPVRPFRLQIPPVQITELPTEAAAPDPTPAVEPSTGSEG